MIMKRAGQETARQQSLCCQVYRLVMGPRWGLAARYCEGVSPVTCLNCLDKWATLE